MMCRPAISGTGFALRLEISMISTAPTMILSAIGIEELAEPRNLPLRAGQIAVEIIGDARQGSRARR